ncbi:sialidase family protein [Actinomadura sp. 7K507]|uniref:sialidase family protein n=1 Tax=Actinomadura sp. 7K507 TaxID=2530365 RepID=UPI001045A81E|nr:sialidase family protein [Actinomadura sp. 7K507]TDC81670.1 hypothetical protein E1285_32165 [Actinomadura sp. 7K507]
MTATGKPDDDHDVERPEPGQPAPAPPPPQWLDDQQPSATPLLPEDDPEPDDPEFADDFEDTDDPEDDGAPESNVPVDDPEDDAEAEPADRTISDRTISDLNIADLGIDESSRTVILPRRQAAADTGDSRQDAGEGQQRESGQPVPPPPATSTDIPMSADIPTSTDIPAPPPFPYTQEAPGEAEAQHPAPPPFPYGQEMPDVTRAERLPPMPPQQPPGYANEMPGAASPPAAGPPAPAPQPSPSQSPPAHEPFPYAQEIPGTPAPAHEPFPYAQQIPGAPSGPPAAEPFPWAQQMPGAPQPGQPAHGQAAHGQAAHGQAAPPMIDEPWRTGSPGKRPRNVKKPLLIGVAGLAVAALVAAGVLIVPGLLDDGDGGDATGAKLAGSIFPLNDAVRTDGRNQEFTSAAAVGTTVVAVGGESGVAKSRDLFLVSTDGGRTFEPAKVEGPDDGSTSTTAPQVVAGSSAGWIAIGSGGSGGAVWTSSDGRTWTRQPDAVGRVFGPGNRVHQVVSTGNGFIAIGANSAKGDFSDAEAAVWSSADGRQWETRAGEQIGLEVNRASYSLVEISASGDSVLLKALVKPDNKKPAQYRKVWRSQDGGRTWTVSEVPVPKGARGLTVGGGEAGFLAIREMGKDKAYGQAFVSKDGETWNEAGKLELDGYGFTMQILGGSSGYTALVHGGGDVLLSHSADGRTWKPAGSAPGKPGRKIAGGALADGQTILVGHDPGGGDKDPLLSGWDNDGRPVPLDPAKIPGVVRPDHAVQAVGAAGPLAVAVGSASGDAAVWTSADGASWKAAQGLGAAFTRPGSQRLLDVAGGQAGWLAVGYDQIAPKRPLVVVSKDGSAWQTADSAAAFGTDKENLATNAAASGSAGYVVVGSEGPSAAAWFSTDLRKWERGSSDDEDALKGSEDAGRWMLDVTGGDPGFTAVGGVSDSEGDRPAVWSSQDGRKWALKELPLPGGAGEGHLTHVAAKGGTLVAAGVATAEQESTWIGYVSTDGGASWRELPVPGGDKELVVKALTATPQGFAATAASGTADAADVVSMTSSDGSNWEVTRPEGTGLSGAGAQEITGLAAFQEKVVGVGGSSGPDGGQPVLWSRPLP